MGVSEPSAQCAHVQACVQGALIKRGNILLDWNGCGRGEGVEGAAVGREKRALRINITGTFQHSVVAT